MKKNGVMIYPDLGKAFNVGDYIQSLAILQFIDSEYKFVEREQLHKYDGEPLKIVLNGWFLHYPENWKPTPLITPLFLSFHLNAKAYKILDNKDNIKYFKQHEPIGCRDFKTKEKLEENGVKAYFSGCLTLTLGEKYKADKKTDEIIFVNPYFDDDKGIFALLSNLFTICFNYKTIKKINHKRRLKLSLNNLISSACFYRQYSRIFDKELIKNGIFINHHILETEVHSEEHKFEIAKTFLERYARAKFVITSKLHCALPCLALGTPVLYVNNLNQNNISSCRLDGLLDLFNVVHYNNGRFSYEKLELEKLKNGEIQNKPDFLKCVDILKEKCQTFINYSDM